MGTQSLTVLEREQELRRYRNYCAEHKITPLLPEAKWKDMCKRMNGLADQRPTWRYLDLITGELSGWNKGWVYLFGGPEHFYSQRLEINPIVNGEDLTQFFKGKLREVGVESIVFEGNIHICVHKMPSAAQ